jgi:hypothetical protein
VYPLETWPVFACAVVLALALILSIRGSSLWTDEAFSAWLASQPTFHSLAGSLLAGDSSDLQMVLYYVYLFLWAKVCGTGELALRAANIPFIALFSVALVWTSWNVFRSRTAWLAAGMLPFIWHFAGEARPYMAVLAFGTAAFGALLAYFYRVPFPGAKALPWITLSCLLAGALFHMLFLLALLPLAVVAVMAEKPRERGRAWIVPLLVFAPAFVLMSAFFAFTFLRGVSYTYTKPGLRSMLSVLYEVVGLGSFGPNRKYSLDFSPFWLPLALGGGVLAAGAVCLIVCGLRNRHDRAIRSLVFAATSAGAEVVVLVALMQQQIDTRHLAALVPVFLFLIVASVSISQSSPRFAAETLLLLGGVWLAADIREAALSEYQKEDYRGAVWSAIQLHNRTGADIALAADSAGAAYYGLDLTGPPPCFPMRGDCASAYHAVPWPRLAPAAAAEFWQADRIAAWLDNLRERRIPGVVVVQLSRDRADSPWLPMLRARRPAWSGRVHGFEIDLIR